MQNIVILLVVFDHKKFETNTEIFKTRLKKVLNSYGYEKMAYVGL